ncbi:ribosome-associated translation inhibitor RaiA [Streptococcus didelphis]|uniref:Ribosome hibernation promoting factor n=1 Tax=Streptococcus didelphis TaxID=102886 RepID=A0ABY9LIB7_9STRE|nr:ribosome-associated translation inhibitor RaiA [Streptococcus didelphis]WMB28592.1 ribosome-associated translation inhibitor RaiA [Streptococcus didelphis]WMB29267.1 ribosome-associated translation inhibitor RaiA [Streptococcus didelphis]
MIKFSIRGENIEVTDAIRNYVESKLAKIEKYFVEDNEIDTRVNLKVYREKTAKVEVTIHLDSVTLRAEDVSQDMYGSIDLVVDKIERQIRKNKTKIAKKHREKIPTGHVFTSEFEAEEVEEVPEIKIVRTKNLTLKPMSVEEARLQMELLGHDFFIYTDAENNETNVLYRREDGNLGLIEAK